MFLVYESHRIRFVTLRIALQALNALFKRMPEARADLETIDQKTFIHLLVHFFRTPDPSLRP